MDIENLDSTTFGQLLVKLSLITEPQLIESTDEAREEGGKQVPDLQLLLRVLERKSLLTNWQSGKVLKGDTDGFFLGGYRILYKISSGSFGRVFRADDPRTGRVVAVKVLRNRWSQDQQRIDLFIREGKVGMKLKHPNIVEVLAISQDPVTQQYYIIMEFVEGGNLREIMQARGIFNVKDALGLIEGAASGLAYAYARGITHRDVKLTNVLISSSGEAKLVDFGLAQMFATLGREEEQVDRTVDYAGLEKATGVRSGDVRSDIYFLGVVLFEMLTGKPPLAMTRDRHARMFRRRFEEALQLKPGEVDAPPSVFVLCETMMSLNPLKRYQTPSQLVEAIKLCRRDVEDGNKPAAQRVRERTIFLAESDQRLQDTLREKLKENGWDRVLIAGDPARAIDRFRQAPYDALVVDAGTVGEDGVRVYERVMAEAKVRGISCAGVLILSEDQAEWAGNVTPSPVGCVLVRPVTMKQLSNTLRELTNGG
jgi:serine/threonine protein kinase